MKNKKYKLTNISMRYEGRTLYRIRALKDFLNVEKGDLGGWVSSEDNLSQEGDCWIYDEAKCMDNARMYDNSKMHDNSKIFGNCRMYDDSEMYDSSEMHDHSEMYDSSEMHDYSRMFDDSKMYGNSKMYDHSMMYDHSKMNDHSEMNDYSIMYNNSEMHGYSKMRDNSRMYNNSKIYDCSIMHGNSTMYEDSEMHDEEVLYGKLASKVDEFVEISIPKGRIITGVLKDKKILYNIGCQSEITKETFIKRIYNEGGGIEKNPHRKSYLKIIDIIEAYFSN